MLFLEHFGITDAGKVRQNNEDSLLVGEGRDEKLFAVADGIGGFEAGEVASSIAVEALKELPAGEPFGVTVQEANRRILETARNNEKLSGMGTTVVAVRFSDAGRELSAEVAHVGDSRAYLMRGGDLRVLTEDHSLVAEMVRSGDLTRTQAAEHPQRNLITRALGAEEEVEVDTAALPVEEGDRFLLCSDGLTDMVSEERVAAILGQHPAEPETPARRLVSAALNAGGVDNVTIVIVDVKRDEPHQEVSDGTREMQVVAPPEGSGRRRPPRRRRRGGRGASRGKRGTAIGQAAKFMVRFVAVLLVVAAALTPVYLWGSSRYFLDFNEGEVVAYRGLPVEVYGVQLNEEWRRTGIQESDIREHYRARIEDNKLYSEEEQVEEILRDLER